jgi:predicted nucleic acid-binding protein
MTVLVDSNVILDLITEDERWAEWSARTLVQAADRTRVIINPIVYAEVSVRFSRIEDLEAALPKDMIDREALPYEAAFLAAKVFQRYRKKGGKRTSTLPDFFIGAHASVAGYELLTRDTRHYRTYFPKLTLITP